MNDGSRKEIAMLIQTIQTMLQNERDTLYHYIDRLQRGIEVDSRAGLRIDGHQKMLDTQKEHLACIDHLIANASDFSAALEHCRDHLMLAEEVHRKAAQHDLLDISRGHSDAWWNSLHDIEYFSDLIQRIESWQKTYSS